MPDMPTSPPPDGAPPDPQAPYGRPAQGPPPGTPPDWDPRPLWPQQPPYPPQQVPTQASYTDWWWDGRKWRPPVPRLSRWQLISQVPGLLIKGIMLLVLLAILLAALGVIH